MNILQIKETCIYTRDLDAARDFYMGLGLPLISEVPGKHVFLRAGSSVLLIFNPDDARLKQSPPAHYAQGPQHFAFEVDEIQYDSAKEFVKSRNIEVIDEVTWKSGAKSFYFHDPAGNVVEVIPKNGLWD